MTVCIGALCDADPKTHSANIILCADNLITYSSGGTPVSSNQYGSKLFALPAGCHGAIADDISSSHVIISKLHDGMKGLKATDPKLLDKTKRALRETIQYARIWKRTEILAHYHVSEDEFLHDRKLVYRSAIQDELDNSPPPTELIVAGFSVGCPILFYTDCVNIQEQSSPGFFTAGTEPHAAFAGAGRDAALHWLNYRGQNCFVSTQRTFYHVQEAKNFSELSPVVGKLTYTLLLRPGEPAFEINKANDSFMQEWIQKYAVRPSAELDKQPARDEFAGHLGITLKPLTSRTSGQTP